VESAVSADCIKMEKEQYRSVILLLLLEGKSRSEFKERLDAVYGDSSPSIGLTSFNVVACRFLMSHAQVPRKQLPRRIT